MLFGVTNYTTWYLSTDENGFKLSNNPHSHGHELDNIDAKVTNLSWEDLINNCGAKVMVENSARATEIFNKKFARKVINWKGYFLSAFIQAYNPFDFNPEHVLNINIRMIPSESLKNADLFLSLNNMRYNKFLSEIRKLKTGDPIEFKATFESLGNEWRSHHLHLIDIKKIDDFIDHEKKLVLFKGIEFDIEGHLKNEKDIMNAQKENAKIIVNNITDVKHYNKDKNDTLKFEDKAKENKVNINRNNTQ